MSAVRYELRERGVFDRELGRAITVMDNEWAAYQVWLDGGGDPDPQPAPPAPDLEFLRTEKMLAVEAIAAEQRRVATSPSSPSEMASWTEKARQARAYDGTDDSAPMLALEGLARGTTTKDIVDRVLRNAEDLTRIEAVIAGTSGRHKDALRTRPTAEEIAAYDIGRGWPFLPPPPPETST